MTRRLVASVCLAVGLGLALGLVALVSHKPAPRFTAGVRFSREHGPFLAGIRVRTISEAERLFGRHIVRPSHPEAGDGAIQRIFFERIPGDPNETSSPLRADLVHIAIDYESGVFLTVELEAGTRSLFDTDPASQYRLVVPDDPGAHTTTVLGAPAMTMPRTATEPAVVDVTLQGERLVLYSDSSALEVRDLLDIAQTLS